MEKLKNHILELEKELLKPNIRQSPEKISMLLSENFIEFCSSGYIYKYKKGEAIEDNISQKELKWEIINFDISILSEDSVLATYKLIKHDEIAEKKYSLRSSIWKSINGKWKMIFHQGTLITNI
ncbi:nuclear transport factor 2 family protein [Clostridium sp. 'White wine YQ']|uniref:nuclear transport factor 2 family protein n=1 Tax=Clostridium sp. 'White wine YQ' TaxID=3027474 RepID=UPI0023661BAF|nr:DUF4440 domain-containing protein [Clostridium sp. 'White wine YQ']MDD7793579.1 DUF4440 domain-containing protein [Clostridium sp. 'White wine YQ']